MIINIRHTGIVVNDLEKMANFYRKLGFKDESRLVEKGSFIEQVVNIPLVKIEWIKLRSPDGFLIELIQYLSHPKELSKEKSKSNDLGCSHVAYTVSDSEKVCALISSAGGSVENPPAISPNGKVKVAYCHDPEGVLMEIVELIN
tara:strand:- start:1123 stop:1557 length:435 start_codon:yes stop_codon:yes gene_type:complete